MSSLQKKKLYLKRLPEIVEALKKGYRPEKIILFGSMADENSPSNDIDLFMIKKTSLKRLGERAEEAEKYLPFDDIPIDLIVYTPGEVVRYKNESILLHEIFKGKVLYG